MKINNQGWFETDPGDPWQFDVQPSPNTQPGLVPQKIVIANTNFNRLQDAITTYQTPNASSFHLVLGRNGRDLVQTVPFDQRSRCTFAYEDEVVSIALDYVPKPTELDEQDPHKYVITVAGNYVQVKVKVYPKEQLDGLLDLLVELHQELGLQVVIPISEIHPPGSMPGPAFPLVQFQEQLYNRTNGGTLGRMALEEIRDPAVLRNAPGQGGTSITAQPLTIGTPVFISEDYRDWVRVEVLGEIDGNPWLVGWVELDKIQAIDYDQEVRGDRLGTVDGRQYRFIPAVPQNYQSNKVMAKEDVKYIVMHTTTGVYIQSTISTFQNKDEGTSAHLVIGREGRIIQMVPFNHAAHHAGSGLWEGTSSVNSKSIGIEMDNAGWLSEGGGRVYAKNGNVDIPASDYQRVRHWQHYNIRPWHTFPEIQKSVTFKAVKALKAHFDSVEELLEHERISLLTRTDPGALFPMEQLRQEVLGRVDGQPIFKRYRLVRNATLYQNSYYQAPKDHYDLHPQVKKECQIEVVFKDCNYWQKVKIVKYTEKPNWEGRTGWIRNADVQTVGGKKFMKIKCDFYVDPNDKIQPPCLPLQELPINTEVRVQKTSGVWSLVATPDHKIGYKFLEGWIRKADLELL